MTDLPINEPSYREDVAEAGNTLTNACHHQSFAMGWWEELEQLEALDIPDALKRRMRGWLVATKLMLTVSEVAEAMEGARKGLMDDHLPHHTMLGTELADVVIRCCDLAGMLEIPLGDIISEKLLYNANRADHQREHRAAPGGKSF